MCETGGSPERVRPSSPRPEAGAYQALAVYPEDTVIPITAIARLWSQLFNSTAEQTRERLDSLAADRLLVVEPNGVAFHDLQREFLLLQTEHQTLLHADLLAAYRTLLPTDKSTGAQLPPDEPYIWERLLYHLQGAGDGPAVIALVTDLAYLTRRCFRSGPYATESDLHQAAELYPDLQPIGWLIRLFRQWGHLLADQHAIGDLAATLASRLRDAPPTIDATSLDPLLPEYVLVSRWGLRSAHHARVLEGHTSRVRGVAFSPDGTLLASAGDDRTVRPWDATTGQPIRTLKGHMSWVTGVAFSPDGRTLASAGGDRTVRLWDATTGQPIRTLEGHTAWVRAVAFSPDGTLLASVSSDRTVRLWDGHGQGEILRLPLGVRVLALTSRAEEIAVGTEEGDVVLFALISRERRSGAPFSVT